MFLSAARYFKKKVIGSNKGISIVLAIIIIIVLGLAGSIFAYLTSSGNITSRSNLTSAAAKYAAKSGVEITFWEMENNGAFFNGPTPQGCPTKPVCPPGIIFFRLCFFGDFFGNVAYPDYVADAETGFFQVFFNIFKFNLRKPSYLFFVFFFIDGI